MTESCAHTGWRVLSRFVKALLAFSKTARLVWWVGWGLAVLLLVTDHFAPAQWVKVAAYVNLVVLYWLMLFLTLVFESEIALVVACRSFGVAVLLEVFFLPGRFGRAKWDEVTQSRRLGRTASAGVLCAAALQVIQYIIFFWLVFVKGFMANMYLH